MHDDTYSVRDRPLKPWWGCLPCFRAFCYVFSPPLSRLNWRSLSPIGGPGPPAPKVASPPSGSAHTPFLGSRTLRAKGLSGCHPSGQQPRQPDGGQRAKIKNFSHNNLLKETKLKAALTGSTGRAKGSPPKKAQRLKKERRLFYAPIFKLQKDVMSEVMRSMMNESQESKSQVHVTV